MATERIDIIISEQGSRVVKRNIQDIGSQSGKSATAVDFLKRALAGIGVVLAVDKVREYADAYTNLQNRLRSTGLEGQNLESVYSKLLRTANDTRAGLAGSIELYSRLALSSKELGVSQNELIGFTRSLNQAITLSGASGTEAQAGLIQLSQGLASGTLRGDELRSVLEQLPAVADVIAKKLGVTRGALRELGAEGKITALTVVQAFQDARQELEERFAKTVPTIAQSFEVLKNEVIDIVGRFDKAVGGSEKLSKAIIYLANNLDDIVQRIGKAVGALLALGAAYLAFKAATEAVRLGDRIREFLAYRSAIAAGTVVQLGSAEAERQRAVAAAQSASATVSATAAQTSASVATVRAVAAETAAKVANVSATQAALVISREETIAKLAKLNTEIASAKAAQESARAAGAQSYALATLRSATIQQVAAEQARAGVLTELAVLGQQQVRINTAAAAAASANAAAQTALTEAQGGAAAANAAAVAASARSSATAAAATAAAAGSTGILAQAFNSLRNAASAAFAQVSRLFVLINTNPFTVMLTALVAVIGLLVVFGDDVLAGIDGITTLGDVARAFGDTALDAFKAVGGAASDAFGGLLDLGRSALDGLGELIGPAAIGYLDSFNGFFDGVGTGWSAVIRGTARVVDAIAGLITGLVLGIVRAFAGLPKAISEIFKRIYNEGATIFESLLNTVIDGINKVREFVGASLLDTVSITKLEVDTKFFEDYGRGIASSIEDGFAIQGGFAEKFVKDTFDKAQEAANLRQELQRLANRGTGPDLDTKGPPVVIPKDTEKEAKKVERALLSLLNQIDPLAGAMLEMKRAQETLNAAQRLGLITAEEQTKYLGLLAEYYRDILDPLGALNREYDTQAKLLKMSSRERDVEAEVLGRVQELQRAGKKLSDEEIQSLRARVSGLQSLNEMVAAQDQILMQTVERRRGFVTQLQAIQNLLADPTSGFTQGDAASAVNEMAPDLFEGTQTALDAQVELYRGMYDQIDQLRANNLINEQTAATARARIDIMANEERLKGTRDFFGNLASLSSSGNKRIAAIGRAAATAQASIDGVVAVQKALAAPPGWPYNAANVIAVGVAAAANVAKIAGFEQGGYTGDMGQRDVAGVVHGREFVVNAEATSRNRGRLEAMNAGKNVSDGGGSNVTVIVNNKVEGTRATESRRDTPDGKQIEITIERVVAGNIRAGGRIADAMEGQYGLNRATGTAR